MTAIDHDPRPLPRDNDNLFTHALGGARISRLGEVTLVMIQGEGAFAAPAREFGIARRWAETRPRRATAARSREALLDRLDAVLAGSNGFTGSRGCQRRLHELRAVLERFGHNPRGFPLPAAEDGQPPGPGQRVAPPPAAPKPGRLAAGCRTGTPAEPLPWVLPHQASGRVVRP